MKDIPESEALPDLNEHDFFGFQECSHSIPVIDDEVNLKLRTLLTVFTFTLNKLERSQKIDEINPDHYAAQQDSDLNKSKLFEGRNYQ